MNDFRTTRHTHDLCIKTGKNKERPDRICFVAAGNGTGAGTFPTQTIKNAYVFQVGYHHGYGLTGALPDSHDCPQGYAHVDVGVGTFFDMAGTSMHASFCESTLQFLSRDRSTKRCFSHAKASTYEIQ